MKLHLPALHWANLPDRIRGMFNLNDPRWGRGDDKPEEGAKSGPDQPEADRLG